MCSRTRVVGAEERSLGPDCQTLGRSDMAKRTCLPWPENLLQRMDHQPNGCIHFMGATNSGYGIVWVGAPEGRRLRRAHRAHYELMIGPIPEGMTLDHTCHNEDPTCLGGPTCLHRRCVNLEHLEPKSRGANVNASPRSNARKTHCKWGHEFTPENTSVWRGHRKCRACDRRRWYFRGEATGRAADAILA
jgi:hypothetical protein